MNRRRWFLRFLGRSLGQRKGRVAVASLSVMIATAIAVCALCLSLGIRQKLGSELKAYGANVMVTPVSGYLEQSSLDAVSSGYGVEGYSAQLYGAVTLEGAEVELIGMDFGWSRRQGWKVEGSWPSGDDEVVAGVDVRDALGLGQGDTVEIGSGGRKVAARVSGFLERGGPEDGALLMDIVAAQRLLGLEGKLSAVLVRAGTAGIGRTVSSLGRTVPNSVVKTLKQVASAEESFLGKIELLMVLVTVVVVLASAISVSSTMSATVLERMKEIGLMMAIGGQRSGIRNFYLAEGSVIGVAGGLLGYAVGVGSAEAVSRGAFGSFVGVPLYVLPAAMVAGIIIAVLSSLLPLADALRNSPSGILRGE